jgi:hypothetical protein
MKKIFLVILLVVFSCSKDDMNNIQAPIPTYSTISKAKEVVLDSVEIGNAGARDAQPDWIFFRGSATMDNYMLEQLSGGDIQRQHKIFNKDKVAYFQFSLGIRTVIAIDSVFHRHYKILVMYKDSTHENLVAFSKEGPDHFKFIPTGENLLRSGHPSKQISYTATGKTTPYYNEVRFTNYGLKRWQLKMDNNPIKADTKEPTSKSTTQYQPAHSY